MNMPDFYDASAAACSSSSSGGGGGGGSTPPSGRRELKGPRPTPLTVSKDSHKIKKPPVAPNPSHGLTRQYHAPPPAAQPPPKPMIIYTVSPKVIHTTVSDFMLVVQRLTGSSSSSSAAAATAAPPSPAAPAGALSPAARLASIERTSPSERERGRERTAGDLMAMEVEGVEIGRNPGILSPAPATLPAISAALFSPASDPNTFPLLNDLSPFFAGNSFLPSPSGLFSAPMVSPTPSPDIFNQFMDF